MNDEALVRMIVTAGTEENVLEELNKIEQVTEAFILLGDIDIIAHITAEDEKTLKEIISHKIRKIGGIEDTDTLIVTKSFKR
jgi:DNA-binding Lrp family transcriptional regulator